MDPFRSILVELDATDRAQPALERAAHLARASGAALTLVDVLEVPAYARRYLPADLEEGMAGRRREALDALAAGVSGVPVRARALDGPAAAAVVEEVQAGGHDLVVREAARDQVARRRGPGAAVNLELVRRCPCPVLLVGAGRADHPRIAAAVNTSTEDEAQQALNGRVAAMAGTLARLEGGTVTLLHAWDAFGEAMLRSVASDRGVSDYLEAARRRAADDFARFRDALDGPMASARAELRRGEAEDVIPEFVVADGIDLVVLGTRARRGIPGFFVGNTAERILPRLPCSVLVVKAG